MKRFGSRSGSAANAPRSHTLLLLNWSASAFLLVAVGPTRGAEPESTAVRPPSAGNSQAAKPAPKAANADSKSATTDFQKTLPGQSAKEVEAALGKPQGKLQTAKGVLWFYSQWKVQFDGNGRVLDVQKDEPVRLTKIDPRFLAASEAADKAAAQRAAADDLARIRAATPLVREVTVISNGGQEVDLAALLPEDKITIVDFYADWCGPCRQISPMLEKLAKNDADVVLLKIDIVNWNTPVARQFELQSIPNIRVFNRSKNQVGGATHDPNQVRAYLAQARKS